MICPNCDGVLNKTGCQACGWKMGDPFPAHRLAVDAVHPLKPGWQYPPQVGEPKVVPIVSAQPEAPIPAVHALGAIIPAPTEPEPAPVEPAPAEPVAEPTIDKPLTDTVQ